MQIDSSPAGTSSFKVGLFKLPLIEVKRELRSGATPPPSPVPNSPALSNSSKTGEIPTFSLISDDEDEDELMQSSQMFIKTEPESQNLIMPEEPIVDEEVYEIFDSDDESMFENHLSQSFSQSFMIDEEPLDKVKKPTRKESAKKDDKQIVDKTKKKDQKTKKKDDEKKQKKDSASASKSSSKKTIEIKKSSKKPKTPTKTDSKKSESDTKDVPNSIRGSSGEDSLRTLRSNQVKESSKESKETPKEGSSKECKSNDSSKNSAKTSHQSEVDRIVQKMIDDSKKNVSTKKAMLVEPHSLPNKENKAKKTVALTNGVVLPPKKQKVTFKENLTEIREFDCLGNMKKLSTMPTYLLKEHPRKLPGLQWNAHLLRSSRLVADICQWNIKWLNVSQFFFTFPPCAGVVTICVQVARYPAKLHNWWMLSIGCLSWWTA